MNRNTLLVILISVTYAIIAYLLFELTKAVLGLHSLLWGNTFSHYVVKFQTVSLYIYLLLGVLYTMMLAHIVYMIVTAKPQPRRDATTTRIPLPSETMTDFTFPTEKVNRPEEKKACRPAPEFCLKYWKQDGEEGQSVRMKFEELRKRGSLILGQPDYAHLSFGDSALAPRHAELLISPEGHLNIKHLMSGAPNSLRLNGHNLDMGQSMRIEGTADIFLGATHIIIRTR